MNLLDVIPISESTLPIQTEFEGLGELDEAKTLVQTSVAVKTLAQTQAEHAAVGTMQSRAREQYVEKRNAFFGKHLTLPEGHYREDGGFDLAMRAPKVRLSTVRDIADRIGFVAIPFAYLDPRSYSQESERKVVTAFAERIGKAADIYALAPVRFYSAERHVTSEKDAEIYAPEFIRQAFLAVDMVIPMFRAMSKQMASIKDTLRVELKNLEKRMDGLQALVEKHIRETLEKMARQEQEHARQMRALEARAFVREDPLLLALPRGESIQSSDCYAILGPCRGPDAPDILFEAANLARIEGQRPMLTKLQEGWATLTPAAKPTAASAIRTASPKTFMEMEEMQSRLVPKRRSTFDINDL